MSNKENKIRKTTEDCLNMPLSFAKPKHRRQPVALLQEFFTQKIQNALRCLTCMTSHCQFKSPHLKAGGREGVEREVVLYSCGALDTEIKQGISER